MALKPLSPALARVPMVDLGLDIDPPTLGHLNNLAALGLVGEGTAEVALYLIRTGLERLATEGILKLESDDDHG